MTPTVTRLIPRGLAHLNGFWKSTLIARHNEWLLRELGTGWCDPLDCYDLPTYYLGIMTCSGDRA